MNRKLLLPILASLALVACGREDVSDDAVESVALLEHVPADTPYLMANLQHLPDETVEHFWDLLEIYGSDLERQLEQAAEAVEEEDSPLADWTGALSRELSGQINREGLRDRGIDINTHYAFYGHRVLPVLRMMLADGEAFRAMLQRLEDDAGQSIPEAAHGDHGYYRLDLGEVLVVMALDEDELMISLLPESLEEAKLPALLGEELPEDAFSASRLAEFNRDEGYLPYGSGFVDLKALVERFLTDTGTEMDALRQMAGVDLDDISAACSAEYRALVAFTPRMVTGYRVMEADHMTTHARLVLADELAESMTGVVDTPMAIEEPDEGQLNLALALDLVALRDLVRDHLSELVENPPECDTFAHIRDNAESWYSTVNQPIPPIITNIKGFRLQLSDFNLVDQRPEDPRGLVSVHMRNPQLMFGMAEMFSPDLAALEIRPGGEPKRIPPGIIPAEGADEVDMFIAMSDDAIGLAASEAEAGRLHDYMEAGKGEGGSLLGLGYDGRAWAEFMAGLNETTLAALGEDLDDEDREAAVEEMARQADSAAAMAEIIRRTWMRIGFSDKGMDFEQTLHLGRED